ncbi:amidohydrolase [Phenylobacterium sp.]|uniref:amidohydrolase n=1 Tax=Phenylobacterium sp. TaxID=1871053 RepID=UPI00286C7EDF|nr:amidohydrolase [Phenylobacterium sp.]
MIAGSRGRGSLRLAPAAGGLFAAIAWALSPLGACAAGAEPDVIYLHGHVLTADAAHPRAEAVAVGGGRILAVGRDSAIASLRGPHTQVVDLTGKTMTPGFVDGHSHIGDLAAIWRLVDLSPSPVGTIGSIAGLQQAMRTFLADHAAPADQMVIGIGYDDSLMSERRHPNIAELDAVSAHRPICVVHVSGHLARCNHAALKRLSLDASSPDPKGGRLGRDAAGQLTGALDEQAVGLALAALPAPSPAEAAKALDEVQTYYASQGYTTAQDGQTSSPALGLLQAASAAGALRLDVVAYPKWTLVDDWVAHRGVVIGGPYVNHLKFAGVKISQDGSPQGKTAYLTKPYLHPPAGAAADYRGYSTLSAEELDGWYDRFMGRGWQVQTHCNGDACIDMVLAAISKAYAAHPDARATRPVIVHSQVTRQDQLAAYRRLGIFPTFFAEHTFYWGDWHRDETLGRDRAAFISPTAAAQKLGIDFSLHTDAPVVPPSAMHVWWSAVNRVTRSGRVLGPGQRISPDTALEALTLWPAWQQFDETIKGSITPGKYADLVILDADPTRIDPMKIKDVKVLTTIKDGVVIYQRGETPVARQPFAS